MRLKGEEANEEIDASAGQTFQSVTALKDPLAGMEEAERPFELTADAWAVDYPGQPREENGRFAEGKKSENSNNGDHDTDNNKPRGFVKNKNGKLTLDNAERERYSKILVGQKTGDGNEIKGVTPHSFDRIAQRELPPARIIKAISSNGAQSRSDPTCDTYDKGGVRVVVNRKTGWIVSVMYRKGAK